MKQNKCIVCDSVKTLHFLAKNSFDIYKCQNCDLLYVFPQPNSKKLIEDYYSEKAGYHSKLTADLKKIKKDNKKYFRILDKLIKFKIKGNLLDVGCSIGTFLSMAKEREFNVYGIEANKRTAEIANNNKLNVFAGVLKNIKFKDNYFSAIHLGDIIEHVPNPVALLKESKRILKKEGIIIISTPNLDCFWARITHLFYKWFNFPWSVAVPPYHLFLFSQSNLEKLLYEMKFKILDINYHRCSLRHELGSTGLFRKFKKEKSVNIFFYTSLVFLIYVFIYLIDYLIIPFKKRDFEMTIFVKNEA